MKHYSKSVKRGSHVELSEYVGEIYQSLRRSKLFSPVEVEKKRKALLLFASLYLYTKSHPGYVFKSFHTFVNYFHTNPKAFDVLLNEFLTHWQNEGIRAPKIEIKNLVKGLVDEFYGVPGSQARKEMLYRYYRYQNRRIKTGWNIFHFDFHYDDKRRVMRGVESALTETAVKHGNQLLGSQPSTYFKKAKAWVKRLEQDHYFGIEFGYGAEIKVSAPIGPTAVNFLVGSGKYFRIAVSCDTPVVYKNISGKFVKKDSDARYFVMLDSNIFAKLGIGVELLEGLLSTKMLVEVKKVNGVVLTFEGAGCHEYLSWFLAALMSGCVDELANIDYYKKLFENASLLCEWDTKLTLEASLGKGGESEVKSIPGAKVTYSVGAGAQVSARRVRRVIVGFDRRVDNVTWELMAGAEAKLATSLNVGFLPKKDRYSESKECDKILKKVSEAEASAEASVEANCEIAGSFGHRYIFTRDSDTIEKYRFRLFPELKVNAKANVSVGEASTGASVGTDLIDIDEDVKKKGANLSIDRWHDGKWELYQTRKRVVKHTESSRPGGFGTYLHSENKVEYDASTETVIYHNPIFGKHQRQI